MDVLSPGTILNQTAVSPGPVKPKGRATATVPCRTHLSVIDMTRFAPGIPGGGGIGHEVGLNARASAEPSDEWEISSKRRNVVGHIAKVISTSSGFEGALRVEAEGHGVNHLGLGSTSAMMTAVSVAVNHALGKPFETRDLRMLIGYNFVEDHPDGVLPGFETGVGPTAGLYGGFVIMSDQLEIAHRSPLPEGWKAIVAVISEDPSHGSGESEAQLLMNRAHDLDVKDAERKCRTILLDLIPAMERKDMDAMTSAVSTLQSCGSKVAEIEHHEDPEGIRRLIADLIDAGGKLAGMSSVGPSVTCVCPGDQANELSKAARSSGIADRVMVADIGNTGYSVEVEN